MRLLIGKGADVNAQGGALRSALQLALKKDRLELVQLLPEMSAEPSAQGEKNRSVTDTASDKGSSTTASSK